MRHSADAGFFMADSYREDVGADARIPAHPAAESHPCDSPHAAGGTASGARHPDLAERPCATRCQRQGRAAAKGSGLRRLAAHRSGGGRVHGRSHGDSDLMGP